METTMYEVKLKSYNEEKKEIKRKINNEIGQHHIRNLKIYSLPGTMALSTICIGAVTYFINPVVAIVSTTASACWTVAFIKYAKDNTLDSKEEIKRLREEKQRLLSSLDKPTEKDKTIIIEYNEKILK